MQYHLKSWLKKIQAADLIVLGLLIVIEVILLRNIDFYPVPNPDVFQYISDSRAYWSFRLPFNIHAPPLAPILIGLVSKLINQPYREVTAAVIINSLTGVATVYFLWLYAKKLLRPTRAFLVVLLMLSNPLFYRVALDATADPVFFFLIMLALWVRLTNKKVAYLISGLAFLAKYEAIVLYGAMITTDVVAYLALTKGLIKPAIKKAVEEKVIIVILIGLAAMGGWWLFISIHNSVHGIPYGNTYIDEIMTRKNDLPQWNILTNLPNSLVFWRSGIIQGWSNFSAVALVIILFILSLIKALLKNNFVIILTGLYVIGHILIHLGFPAHQGRYLYPLIGLLWVMFLYLNEHRSKTRLSYKPFFTDAIVSLSIITIILHNLTLIRFYISIFRNQYADYRMVADWLNQIEVTKPINLIAYQGWILDYFLIENRDQLRPSDDLFKCNTIACVVEKRELTGEIWIIKTSDANKINNFAITELGVLLFHNPTEKPCLTKLVELGPPGITAEVFRYDYDYCQRLQAK